MPEPSLHADGHRAVASSRTGAMLFQGYRVRLAQGERGPEAHPAIGVIATITSDGERVAVTWPTGDTLWHHGSALVRMGSAQENEQHPETRKGYPPPLVHAARPEEEQRWVELTLGQVEDLISMVMDRLSGLVSAMGPTGPGADAELAARYSELLVLKGMLLLGRDDPGASR